MSNTNKVLTVILVLSVVLFGARSSAWAQVTTAAIHGTITDPTGAVIPNASVTALNTSTGIATSTKTDASGYFILPQLHIGGPYTVTITASGFSQFVQSDLTLNLNANREIDAHLMVGSQAQTVKVNAAQLQVQTADTQLKTVITSQTIEQTPMLGRDASLLQKLTTGSVEASDRFGTYSANGSQTPQNSFLLDGADINDGALQDEGIAINPDALAEENIVTSTLNPEFARNSGAIVNEAIKSGTNQFHGSGFEFYRDTFLNNGNYFSLPGQRPVFHQNEFGATLGGPIFKKKLFFFLAYQGIRTRSAGTNLSQVFDQNQRTGNFDNSYNYSTGAPDSQGLSNNQIPFNFGNCTTNETWAQCFPAGQPVSIPSNQWNSVAASLFNTYVPAPNEVLGGASYYNFNALDTSGSDQGILRIDFTPTAKDYISASGVFQGSPEVDALSFGGGTLPGFAAQEDEHYKLFTAAYTHTFTPSLLNVLRADYTRLNFHTVDPDPEIQPSSLGFSITPQIQPAGVPYIAVGPYFALGNSYEGPQPRKDTNLSGADNLTWIYGNHSLKFGARYESFRVSNPFAYLNNGYYYYEGSGLFSSGDPAIDFLLGIPDGYEQTNDGFIDAISSEDYAYAQDSWKVNSDLTLNYGLAWDVETPTRDTQYNGYGIFCYEGGSFASVTFPGAPPGMAFKGDKGCNESGGPTTHWAHFSPRVGVAWSPSHGPKFLIGTNGDHEFSLRGGYGIYYNRDQEEQSLENLTDPPALYTSYGAGDLGGSPSFANPFQDVANRAGASEPNPFPYAAPQKGDMVNWPNYALLEAQSFDKNYTTPYVMNFNLNVQRALSDDMILQVGYVGSLGHRLATWYEADPITAAGHAACAAGTTATIYGTPVACNSATGAASIHEYFPQFTQNPVVVPGTVGLAGFPNGEPWYNSVASQNSEGASNYNSLQISLNKAPTHGLSFRLAYTYSHSLDNASGYESATGQGGLGSTGRDYNYVPGYGYLNYGSSDFDTRHRLVVQYTYIVPVAAFMKHNLLAKEALSGWELSGYTVLQTGFPVSISGSGTGGANSLWCDGGSFFGCADNPNVSTSHISSLNIRGLRSFNGGATGNYGFDPTQFSAEQTGTFGNTGRNFFHGPGYNYTDLQVSKNIPFNASGSRYMQLRLEAYNLFNHANFSNPDGNFNDTSFGQITSVVNSTDNSGGDPQPARSIQLAGKFYF